MARRLACDATLIVALDDELGHTMYEGRAQRWPSATQRREVWRRDRHCVFPGCHNVLFTNCHHVNEWELGGSTDLDNLALMCVHHHYLIHSRDWSMRGDANVELHFVGPNGQVMTTRPSRLWAQVTDPALVAERRAARLREAIAEGSRASAKVEWGAKAGTSRKTGTPRKTRAGGASGGGKTGRGRRAGAARRAGAVGSGNRRGARAVRLELRIGAVRGRAGRDQSPVPLEQPPPRSR